MKKKQMHGTIIFHYLAFFLINFIMRFTSNFFLLLIFIYRRGKKCYNCKEFLCCQKKIRWKHLVSAFPSIHTKTSWVTVFLHRSYFLYGINAGQVRMMSFTDKELCPLNIWEMLRILVSYICGINDNKI